MLRTQREKLHPTRRSLGKILWGTSEHPDGSNYEVRVNPLNSAFAHRPISNYIGFSAKTANAWRVPLAVYES